MTMTNEDLRAEIAATRAEIASLKAQIAGLTREEWVTVLINTDPRLEDPGVAVFRRFDVALAARDSLIEQGVDPDDLELRGTDLHDDRNPYDVNHFLEENSEN
jgi:hypothetical protein